MSVTSPPQTTALERIIIGGDLAQLSPGERVNHYMTVCQALKLDWRTRPFDYLKDRNGKLQMYARKDCTEQLRRRDHISLTLPKEEVRHGVYIVTAHAVTQDGRHDEDVGAVPVEGLKGEMLSNAILKATTKAKRRVTLSICGVGLPDESELDSIPGAVRVAAELPEGAVPSEGYQAQDVVAPPADYPGRPDYRLVTAKGTQTFHTGSEWMEAWRRIIEACQRQKAYDKLQQARTVNELALTEVHAFDPQAAKEILELLGQIAPTPEDRLEA